MRTEVKIPVTPAPTDPDWMIRKHAGKKLNVREIDEYYKWKFDKDNEILVRELRAPTKAILWNVFERNYLRKYECDMNHSCAGWNPEADEGYFGTCGAMNPFTHW